MVIVVVLVIIALLTLVAMTFCELMLAEREASELAATRVQAESLAASGAEAARCFLALTSQEQTDLGGWYDNQTRFRGVVVVDDPQPEYRGRFALVAPAMEDGYRRGIRFGLEDESTRLNLNALIAAEQRTPGAGRTLLMALPGMTETIADSILDWIDADDEPREFGAEVEYYSALEPPYAPKNGPLATVEELLLVRDVTPQLLFGVDANHNGYRDAHEPDPMSIENVDNADGSMDCGWAAFLTLASMERNVRPDGAPRIDLNQDDLETLYEELETAFDARWATFIVAYRQNGPYSGTQAGAIAAPAGQLDFSQQGRIKLTTVLDLVGARTQVKFQGQNEATVLETPFPNVPGLINVYLPVLLDYATVNPSPTIPGRININQASRTVLAGIPGMTQELVDEIVAYRASNPIDADPYRRHETWILGDGIVDLDQMKAFMPYVCAGGAVYRAQAIGYFDQSGPSCRIEVILDATQTPAKVLFWRDQSHLGRGYARETLGIEGF
ncbi:MAG: general secretion pathway protein GspK [Pirellulales bacterium]|nr:general secretion pathway protein GspK [Pirellulales bacterium]